MAAWFGLTGLMFLLTQHLWNSEAFVHGRHLATARSVMKAVKESQSSPPLHQSTGSVGVIIVDHGSKRQSANDMLLEVVERYKQVSQHTIVEAAHMELAEPSIATAYAKCIAQGASTVICHPYFLSRGRHVQDDVPSLLQAAAESFPGSKWVLTEPLGAMQTELTQLIHHSVQGALAQTDHSMS